jgi:hypothetical protein
MSNRPACTAPAARPRASKRRAQPVGALTGAICYGPRVSDKPKPDTAEPKDAQAPAPDVMLVHGVSDDGKSLAVLRARNNTLEAGVVRAVAEGEPIQGEVVRLTPRPDCPVVCDVEVTVPRGALNARGGSDARQPTRAELATPLAPTGPAAGAPRRHGPAQVATPRYRDNWEAIWQKPGRGGKLPN